MRIYIFFLIIFIFGLIGFEIKKKYIEQRNFLLFLKSFIEYLKLNITLYRSNLQEIINNYIIMQNNKNAKYVNLFLKNSNINANNAKIIESYITDKNLNSSLESYFLNLGKEDVDGENKKSESILKLIDDAILKANDEIKTKGDLYFKIMLAIGVVFVIVLW